MIRDEQVYIAWHSGIAVSTTGVFGTASVNTDDRLWNDAGGPFFLSFYEKGNTVNYAVSDADAEEFISRVLARSEADLAEGAAPSPPAFGIAGIPDRVGTEIRVGMKVFPFRDAALMKSWLGELRLKCGEPLSAAEFYRASHPTPVPPEGAVEVTKIVEQQVLPYRPPAALGPGPDNCRSELLAEGGFAVLSVFQNGMHLEYVLPPELLPEVNAAAGGLLAGQLDAPRKEGDEDAWVPRSGRGVRRSSGGGAGAVPGPGRPLRGPHTPEGTHGFLQGLSPLRPGKAGRGLGLPPLRVEAQHRGLLPGLRGEEGGHPLGPGGLRAQAHGGNALALQLRRGGERGGLVHHLRQAL